MDTAFVAKKLADPHWKPSRALIESARNKILELRAELATVELRANGGVLSAEKAAAFMRPLLLDGAYFKHRWQLMVMLAALSACAGIRGHANTEGVKAATGAREVCREMRHELD